MNDILYLVVVLIFVFPLIKDITISISLILNYNLNLYIKTFIYIIYLLLGYLSINYKKDILSPKFDNYRKTLINSLLIITIITLVLYIYWIFMGYGDLFSVLLTFNEDYNLESLKMSYQWDGFNNEVRIFLLNSILNSQNFITIEWIHSIVSWFFLVIFSVYHFLKKHKSLFLFNIVFIILFVLTILGLLYESIKINNILRDYFGRQSSIYGWGYIDAIASYINALFTTVILVNVIGLIKSITNKTNISWPKVYLIIYLIVNVKIIYLVFNILLNFHINSFILLLLFIAFGILGYFLIKREYNRVNLNKVKLIKYIVISLFISSVFLFSFYKINDANYIRNNFEILKY